MSLTPSTAPALSVRDGNQPLLRIRGIKKYFPVRRGFLQRVIGYVKAVDDVNLDVLPGETLGLVGESGCGKSTLGRSILRLVEPTEGTIEFEGHDITKLGRSQMKPLRADMQMIFQDPVGSLNPRMSVGDIVGEGLLVHGMRNRPEREKITRDMLRRVGLRPEYANRYPHEFSGGQRQRIGIARALALSPKLIIADEPVSALDVSIQSQVLNLLVDLRQEFGLTYIFVAHNLAVVSYISDRVAVMYLGQVMELAEAEELYKRPLHPYTQGLLRSIPRIRRTPEPELPEIPGVVPALGDFPAGCAFAPRCAFADAKCHRDKPELLPAEDRREVACWKPRHG